MEKDDEQDAVVCVRRSSCERVTDKEEFVGRLRALSRLPQYLRFKDWLSQRRGGERGESELDNGNVDRSTCAGPVALGL